jgi:hypothetical protein
LMTTLTCVLPYWQFGLVIRKSEVLTNAPN